MRTFQFKGLFRDNRWISPCYVEVDTAGKIIYIDSKPPRETVSIEYVDGYALPGFQNAHSHAFQYAMAGRAEIHAKGAQDDFWSWREAMYGCALSMDPDQMQAVATMLYIEMLRKGYTHVAEFHYLHHDKNGKPYNNLAEMGVRLLVAAKTAGIKITLIPVFYQKGGFGLDPQPRQRRFISSTTDDYLSLLDDTAEAVQHYENAWLGFSVHSLRAVEAEDIKRAFKEGPKNIPFHLHAAEQLKEIDDCVAYLGQRPVEWVLGNLPADDRFHLVHCTHMTDAETLNLAQSKANAVLCPGTEGNLGDGIFRLTDFAKAGGSWSIGTDSHISLNFLEDLRWLDYAQRFTTHRRNTFDRGAEILLNKTFAAGRKAMGLSSGYFNIGDALDCVVFSAKAPLLQHNREEHLLSSIVYNCDSADIIGTIVNAGWVVKDQIHAEGKSSREKFKEAINQLQF